MSLKIKILIGLIAVYSVVISVLLVIAGQRLSAVKNENLQYENFEKLISDVKSSNEEIMNQISKDESKIDSISSIITRVEISLASIEASKKGVKKKYQNEVAELSNKSLLELKEIALAE